MHLAERRSDVGVRLPALDHEVVELARAAGRTGRPPDGREPASGGVQVGQDRGVVVAGAREDGVVAGAAGRAREEVVERAAMSTQRKDLPERHAERPYVRLGRHLALSIHASDNTHTHTHTHPFKGPFSGTTQMSRYQKGKTNLDFTEARDSEWQWHQHHVQVCTSLQTDDHATPHNSVFYRPGALAAQPTASKH